MSAKDTVMTAIRAGVVAAALDPTATAVPRDMANDPIAINQIVQRVAQQPELQHVFSTEDFWQSRANWSMIFSAITSLSAFGYLFTKFTGAEWTGIPSSDLEAYSALAAFVCGGIASYLARRARTATRPIGT